jgi:flagellar biogenesis protein FliO
MRRLELAERLALTPQHSLFVVRVSDRALVLGASPQGFRVLANIRWAEMEKAG